VGPLPTTGEGWGLSKLNSWSLGRRGNLHTDHDTLLGGLEHVFSFSWE
jgi:hypothetical protein